MNVDTQEHLTSLRELLSYRVRELEADLRSAATERARSATEIDMAAVNDRKDEADAEQREEVAAREESLARAALQRCRAALHRLDQGVYGDCCDCGEPIPLARLTVQPEVERCAPCQARHERVTGHV